MKMTIKRKYIAVVAFLIAALLFAESGVTIAYADTPVKTSVTQGSDIVVTSWLSESDPKENVSMLSDISYMQVGVSKKGKDSVGLVHFDLPAGITPDEVVGAKLLLKKKSGDTPDVEVGIAEKAWSFATVSWREMKGKTKYAKRAPQLKAQGGDWYAADVTKIVKNWLAGKADNFGFALKGKRNGNVTKFVSALVKNKKNYPALKITYKNKKLKKSYGKYGYTKQPMSKGNCFSYAMRDTDEIFTVDILTAAQYVEFQDIANKSLPSALNYFKQRVCDYINAHQAKLGIKSWRVLSSYKDKYDPKTEYLVAMKIGFLENGYGSGPGGSYDVENDFDYHWRVRLKDGRWAEKITHTKTRIVPGSNPSCNSAKYPWDSNYLWGYTRFNGYYNSKPVYFAITKSTNDFTAHKH
jgi:hypothetical protein